MRNQPDESVPVADWSDPVGKTVFAISEDGGASVSDALMKLALSVDVFVFVGVDWLETPDTSVGVAARVGPAVEVKLG